VEKIPTAGASKAPADSFSGRAIAVARPEGGASAWWREGRGPAGRDDEARGLLFRGLQLQGREDGVAAIDGLQRPTQRHRIAPIAVGMKQILQRAVIGLGQRTFKLRQPVFGGNRNVVGLVEHA